MKKKMTLKEKIWKAINEAIHDSTGYTDDYDGFTHQSYSGLADDVENELFEEGYEDDAPMSVVEDFVGQMI